jgi:hypothetical protein
MERSALFRHENKYYYVFAKTGFTEGVQAEAVGREDVTLIRFENF